MLLHSGDNLLAWLLIWSIFLPLGARASVDRFTATSPPIDAVRSIASAAILLQVLLMYLAAVTAKSFPGWRSEFSAVHAFLTSHIGTPLGKELARFGAFTRLLTAMTLIVEFALPPIAIAAFKLPRLRTAIALFFIFFHLCLGLTLYVGTFAWIPMAAWLLFIPRPTWDSFARNPLWRALIRTWNAIVSSIARTITRLAPPLTVHKICPAHLGPVQSAVVAILLAYIAFVNVMESVPFRAQRLAGPLARLPRLRQIWGVMAELPQGASLFLVQAQLSDGTQVDLVKSSELLPESQQGPLRMLWPPDDCRLVAFHQRLIKHTYKGKSDLIAAYCDYLARKTNQALAPTRQVVSMTAYFHYREVLPIDAAPDFTPNRVLEPLYTWPPPAPSS